MPTNVGPTLLMNIADMIDLSIGAPECGNVDFNMLHTLLHCIVQQIKIRDKPVELRGDIAVISIGDMRNMKTVSIDEYLIGTGNQESDDIDDTLLVVERLWKLDAEDTKSSPLKLKQDNDRKSSFEADETNHIDKITNRPTLLDKKDKPQNKTIQKINNRVTKKDVSLENNTKYEISDGQKGYSEEEKEYSGNVPSKDKTTDKSVNQDKYIIKKNITSQTRPNEDTSQKFSNEETLPTPKVEILEKILNEEDIQNSPKDEISEKRQKDLINALEMRPLDTTSEKLSKFSPKRDSGEREEKYLDLKEKQNKNESLIITENMLQKEINRKILTEKSSEKLSLVTKSKFEELEAIVKNLQETVYGCIPENEKIIHEVRSQGNLKSITDMWTSLNISLRLKATENAIQKLGSIMQDVIGESGREMDELKTAITDAIFGVNLNEDNTEYKNEVPEYNQQQNHNDLSRLKTGVNEVGNMQSIKKSLREAGTLGKQSNLDRSQKLLPRILSTIPLSVAAELQGLQKEIFDLRTEFDILANHFYADESADESKEKASNDVNEQNTTPETNVASTLTIERRRARPKRYHSSSDLSLNKTGLTSYLNVAVHRILVKINKLDNRIKKCSDDLNKDKGQINDKIVNMQDQMEAFTKALTEVGRSMKTSYPNNVINSVEGMMEIGNTVKDIHKQLNKVHKTAQQLTADKETRQMQIDILVEQIEHLKHIKMDREDIEVAIGEKADITYCERKVNLTDFEQACEDLSKGLYFALEKLKLQESIWHSALDEIQREINTKLDKQELMPVKDFFNDKLLSLQVNLKKMMELRREAEAAGTRKRLLRGVNCISCDAKVVMSMDPPEPPAPRPAPCSLSMKPYLTYELDTIRKTQNCIIPQRNMRDWEQIEKQTRQSQRVRSDTDKHICNRYCGGNHTVTTPAQRVARTGHFVAQWGPDVISLTAKMAAGDDGRMCKVNMTESTLVGPNEIKGEKRIKDSGRDRATTHTPLTECRCLESSTVRSEKDSEKSLPKQSLSKANGAK